MARVRHLDWRHVKTNWIGCSRNINEYIIWLLHWLKIPFREGWLLWSSIWHDLHTYPHCAFSSNLFHGQVAQIHIDQLSDPKSKKCSPWKVFGINHPQTPGLLSRRGPRCLEARLSQHYIGQKMTFLHFSNFCRKKVSQLDKKASAHFYTIRRL